MPYEALEERRMYQRAEALADQVWEICVAWSWFAKKTLGIQWARATDSIGANIAEAGGRYSPGEVRTFLYYARGSLRKSKYWLRRAYKRGLVSDEIFRQLDGELEHLSSEINQSIRFQKSRVKEPGVVYEADSPQSPPHNPATSPPNLMS